MIHGLPHPSSALCFLEKTCAALALGPVKGGDTGCCGELRQCLQCDGGLHLLTEDLAGRPLPSGGFAAQLEMLLPFADPSTAERPRHGAVEELGNCGE